MVLKYNVNNKKIILISAAVLVLIAAIALSTSLFRGGNSASESESVNGLVPIDDAFDVAIEFYNQWLAETQSTTTNPFDSGLINSTRLSNDVRTVISDKRATKVEGDLDAVLCQAAVPERVGGKEIFKSELKAQVMVLARGFETKSPYQAIVDLDAIDGNWQITKIECLQSEVAPVSEYDFERSGYLLKSVVAPLTPGNWHLIYEENGKPGHALPLIFDAESICVAVGGVETVCDPSQFVEPVKVLLQADMLDIGADVQRVTFE
jgi:hypothetical protein